MREQGEARQATSNRSSLLELCDEAMGIAAKIHYPECWDTINYPTLKDAVLEVIYSTGCNPHDCIKQTIGGCSNE